MKFDLQTMSIVERQERAKRLRSMVLIVVAITVTVSVTGSVFAWLSRPATPKDPDTAPKNSVTTSNRQSTQAVWNGQRPTAALVTITPRGFEPSEVTVPAGRVLLAVDNRSGLREIALELDQETSNRPLPVLLKTGVRVDETGQRQVRVSREKLDWRGLNDLQPGRYLLREVEHLGWSCRITVTKN